MVTLTLQVHDEGAQLLLEHKFNSVEDLENAIRLAVPLLAVKSLTTVHVNTLNWKIGFAKVEQNSNMERTERYQKTGN